MNGRVTKQKRKRNENIQILTLEPVIRGCNIVQEPEVLVYHHVGHTFLLYLLAIYKGPELPCALPPRETAHARPREAETLSHAT